MNRNFLLFPLVGSLLFFALSQDSYASGKSPEKPKIRIIFTYRENTTLIKTLAKVVAKTYKARVDAEIAQINLNNVTNTQRNQVEAYAMLQNLLKSAPPNGIKTIYIIDRDAYVEDLNFVFGDAIYADGIAMISTARLHQSFYGLGENPALYAQRIQKETLHELGHLFGFDHTQDTNCFMAFSNDIEEVDQKGTSLCGAKW